VGAGRSILPATRFVRLEWAQEILLHMTYRTTNEALYIGASQKVVSHIIAHDTLSWSKNALKFKGAQIIPCAKCPSLPTKLQERLKTRERRKAQERLRTRL
jgi:hypothetical protein